MESQTPERNQRPAFIAGRLLQWSFKSGFRRGRLIHQSLEGGGLVDGEVGTHLAVDLDTGAGEPADKSAVGHAVLAASRVYALDPERAEIPLALLAADIIVLQRLIDSSIGRGDVVLATAAHAFGLLEDIHAA